MSDSTLYDTTAPSEGSLALAHQKLLRLKQSGAFVNITGDINNLALNPTPITVQREVYGTKGRNSTDIIGYNFAPTFDVEVMRDPVTKEVVAAQAWVIDLINAAYAEGGANKRDFQIITDALDERFPTFEGTFSVAVADLNTGYADKGGFRFTLNNDGVVERLSTSPIAGTGEPLLESASPTGQAPGDLIVVRGYRLGSTVSATVGGTAVTELRVVDDNTLVLQIPTGITGSAPIIVTNSVGASNSQPYTAA
ncbi:IPT/TIG domain-containing protein [Microbacterium sp. KR10-403]|uniref:IPT/TIG domain-containing protein n=1 Tax=Microbacterium sp. KR10-403 TaxID=3158581 RepID=UPI0032E43D41